VGGIDYEAGAGDIIYYFESEEVESFCGPDGVEFYSAAFSGQRLRPFPPGRRVLPSNAAARRAFESLYKASLMPESAERTLRVFSGLLMALAEIGLLTQTGTQNPSGKLWSDIEAKLRERKLFRPSMGDLCRISGKSRSAVARACAEVSGASPLRRVRETRMAEAAGLLRHTDMSVSDVAAYLGYPRMHEFSREFSGHFGHPPTALRKKV
jgi:AraC-like DNA-binding protein